MKESKFEKFKKFLPNLLIGLFLFVPFLSSTISTFHLVDFFNLGNAPWMSYILAITFEVGSIAALLILTILDDIKAWMVYVIFFILVSLQIIGNIYYSLDYINSQLLLNPNWLNTAKEMVSYLFFTGNDIQTIKFLLSAVIGVPIPLISLLFLKSVVDKIKTQTNKLKSYVKNEEFPGTGTGQPAEEDLYRGREGSNTFSDDANGDKREEPVITVEENNEISLDNIHVDVLNTQHEQPAEIQHLPGFNPPIVLSADNE